MIDDAKLAHIIEKNESSTDSVVWLRWVSTLPLAGRDLTGADLSQADVRHVEFSHAILNRASLSNAWAEKARFAHAELHGAQLNYAQLHAATLGGAQLLGASLDSAYLQGASLDSAQLQGASLDDAQLQGASLDSAQLQGASLDHTAQLQGASLDHAQLQGVQLDWANLQGASFVDMCVWRADARLAHWKDTRVAHPETDPIGDKADDKIHGCDWTAASFVALRQLIAKEVPESSYKRAIMQRIEQNLDPAKALESEDKMAENWAAHERESPTPEAYAKSLAGLWCDPGYPAEAAPYVRHALVARVSNQNHSPLRDQSDAAKALAAAFLDEEQCAGAHGLSEADKAKLKKIAATAAPPAPKQ